MCWKMIHMILLLRIADAFELMGSTFLLDMHDVGSTLFFWRKALQIRHNGRYSSRK